MDLGFRRRRRNNAGLGIVARWGRVRPRDGVRARVRDRRGIIFSALCVAILWLLPGAAVRAAPSAAQGDEGQAPAGDVGQAKEDKSSRAERRRAHTRKNLKPVAFLSREDRKARRARLKAERKRLKAERKQLKAEMKSDYRGRGYGNRRRSYKRKRRQLERDLVRAKKRQAPTIEVQGLEQQVSSLEQQEERVAAQVHEKKVLRGRIKDNRSAIQETKDVLFFPAGTPSYSPELGFVVAAVGLLSFRGQPGNPDLKRSSMPMAVGISSTGAIIASALMSTFWLDDWLRVNSDFWLKRMPDNYWGVGYHAARARPKPTSATNYNRLWWQVNPRFLARLVLDSLYAGVNVDFNRTIARSESETMLDDDNFAEFGRDNYNAGLGAILLYDSRDVPQNAWRGVYAKASMTFYGPYIGGFNEYQVLSLEYRQYVPIVREGSTLAWAFKMRTGLGDVPWGELSQLGTPFDLRGYVWGRYRDTTLVYGIMEYRYMFKRLTPSIDGNPLSRHGFVVWGGVGSVGDGIPDLLKWLPNWGVGYRFELQPRLAFRVDWGFGNDTQAFYFNITEAF
jgi:hypothetical protein